MKRELGGKRVGSGNKMEISMKEYGRSTHNQTRKFRTTMACGTIIPALNLLMQPGDTIDIDIEAVVLTKPTVGPLFGSYKLQIDAFEGPLRLYQKLLHNNMLKTGLDMSQVLFPLIELSAPITDWTKPLDNQQINPSCIFSYLGIRGIGNIDTITPPATQLTRRFSAYTFLQYWDSYKNYYANKQEEEGAVIHFTPANINHYVNQIEIENPDPTTVLPEAPAILAIPIDPTSILRIDYTDPDVPDPAQIMLNMVGGVKQSIADFFNNIDTSLLGTIVCTDPNTQNTIYNWEYATATDLYDGEPKIVRFPLENIDNMREEILAQPKTSPIVIPGDTNYAPYNLPFAYISGGTQGLVKAQLANQEGLAIKTYQADIFNNWLKTEWISGTGGINDVTKISTAGNSFTIDQLNFGQKMYNLLNRIAVAGGSYKDWIETVYTTDSIKTIEIPVYVGGMSKELIFDEVISNAQSTDQPLGTLAGRGMLTREQKGGKLTIKPKEWGYLQILISLTPRIDYTQGNAFDMRFTNMNDLHKPELDAIGFQDLITENMAWWDTYLVASDLPDYRSAGKQPAWIDYMTNFDVALGNFAEEESEMFMVLARRYEGNPITKRIADLTTYIDPVKFNYIFAETRRDAQNFWTQIKFNITNRRVMSAKIMPNL